MRWCFYAFVVLFCAVAAIDARDPAETVAVVRVQLKPSLARPGSTDLGFLLRYLDSNITAGSYELPRLAVDSVGRISDLNSRALAEPMLIAPPDAPQSMELKTKLRTWDPTPLMNIYPTWSNTGCLRVDNSGIIRVAKEGSVVLPTNYNTFRNMTAVVQKLEITDEDPASVYDGWFNIKVMLCVGIVGFSLALIGSIIMMYYASVTRRHALDHLTRLERKRLRAAPRPSDAPSGIHAERDLLDVRDPDHPAALPNPDPADAVSCSV